MSEKVWLGGIFLRDEGGYEIVSRALKHYLRRLKNISTSPEISDSPMFVQIVQQEANKNGPIILELAEKLKQSLNDPTILASIQNDIDYIQKALSSYKTDILKAIQNDEYYSKLIDPSNQTNDEIQLVENAQKQLTEFS